MPVLQVVENPQTVSQATGRSIEYAQSLVGRKLLKQDFVVGLELEIEAVASYDINPKYGILVEEDGSLRNYGREFLVPPSTIPQAIEKFNVVHRGLERIPEFPKFSERTSVHVHVNCLLLDENELMVLLLLYQIFEPLAFQFVHPSRANNIHCVPLVYTCLPNYYGRGLWYLTERWHKYTALNVKPLHDLGTIEFRHLHGTDSAEIVETWLTFLWTLYNNCLDRVPTVDLFKLDFLRSVEQQLISPRFKRLAASPIVFRLEDNLIDAKLTFV